MPRTLTTQVVTALLAAAIVAPALSNGTPAVPPDAIIHASYESLGGDEAVRSVRLMLDGQDVTAQATVSRMHVEFRPPGALPVGSHAAEVVVTDSLGRAFSKQWSFEVVGPEAVEVPQFFAGDLMVQLDPLPRRTRLASVRVGGVTQPSVEVVLRMDEQEVSRTFSSPSGRFEATVDLPAGESLLQVAAFRPTTGEEGDETVARIERVGDKMDAVVNPWAQVHEGPVSVERPRPGNGPVANGMPDKLDAPRPQQPDPRENVDGRPGTGRAPRAGEVARGEMPVSHIPEALPRERRDGKPGATRPSRGGDIGRGEIPVDLDVPDAPPRERHENPQPRDQRDARVGDFELPRAPEGEVVILKPTDGETFRADHVTVLGRAPAGWTVSILVDDEPQGSATANPMGHFTVPRVMLAPGEHEVIAEAESPDGHVLRSEPVQVRTGEPMRAMAKALSISSPARSSSVARDRVQRVEGMAWPGAEIEIEVNGHVAARELADERGFFSVDVPLESGINLLGVEAIGEDGASSRVSDLAVQAPARARARVAPGLEARPGLQVRPRPSGIPATAGRPTLPSRKAS